MAASAPTRLGFSRSPARDDQVAGGDVGAAPADVLAGRGGREDINDVIVVRRGLLDHHDGIGAVGQRRAGGDLGARAGRDRDARHLARVDAIDDPEA